METEQKKKYILTDFTIEHEGHTLHRIRALRDFAGIKVGDLKGNTKISNQEQADKIFTPCIKKERLNENINNL